jgi:Rrf2 family protein
MITRKSTYALRALATMARQPERLYSLSELADSEAIPRAYLTLILGILRRHGVLQGLRGPSGGYALASEPNEITLARVIEILDGPLFLSLDCLNAGAEPCPECTGSECALREALGAADRSAWKVLELVSVRDLIREPGRASEMRTRIPSAPEAPEADSPTRSG